MASAGEVLVGTYAGKVRRCELTWTRYLPKVLQEKLILQEPGLHRSVMTAVEEIYQLMCTRGDDKVAIYGIIPRKNIGSDPHCA